ncbi:MAG: hypothetical protein GY757_04475 [bacterium]|nr:hypothetical protein [bacterium]
MRKKIGLLLLFLTVGFMQLPAKKIDVYGYSDFMFSYWETAKGTEKYGFSQNRTNVLLASEVFKKWDFFVNVEFTGQLRMQAVGSVDETGIFRSDDWIVTTESKVELEEAWTRFTLSDKLVIKAGSFYASFGRFNVDQDISPNYITVRPPMIYDDAFRSKNPVGIIPDKANLEVQGSFTGSTFTAQYHLYLGNSMPNRLYDENLEPGLSWGTRLLFNFDENLKIGFSSYFDKVVHDKHYNEDFLWLDGVIKERRSLFSLDVDYTFGRFNLNGEYIWNRNESEREDVDEFTRTFFYINGSAEIASKLRLYAEFDQYRDNFHNDRLRTFLGNGINKVILGLNFKPNWVTAIKAEVQHYFFNDSTMPVDFPGQDYTNSYTAFMASLSIVF